MIISKIKKIIKKNESLFNFAKLVIRNFLIFKRLKDILLMMILFNIYPNYTYKFSTRKFLPPKKNRLNKTANPYKIIKNKSNLKKMGEINYVTVGSSFKLNNIKKLKGKIFFAPGWEPLRIDKKGNIFSKRKGWALNAKFTGNIKLQSQNKLKDDNYWNKLKIYKEKNITYCISRKEVLNKYLKKGYNFLSIPTYHKEGKSFKSNGKYWNSKSYRNLFKYRNFKSISVLENFYLPSKNGDLSKWVASGSTLPYLFALSKYAKKINVYGWDFYLEKSPTEMSYWEIFFSLYNYKLDVLRSNNHFESALINFYYGYLLSKTPNIKIHGYLGRLKKHKKFINKVEKVLFK